MPASSLTSWSRLGFKPKSPKLLRREIISIKFTWDNKKEETNLKKHGISFAEAATAISDPLSVVISDPDHSDTEDRWVVLGYSDKNRVLVVVVTYRDDIIRIISSRIATPSERRGYING